MNVKAIILTCIITILYSLIWMILERAIYKEIQPRIVDDIMMLLFIPFIYYAIR